MIKVRKSSVTFYILFTINLIVAFFSSFLLPKRYFYDAIAIILDKYHEIGWVGSYPLSMQFYKITGLKYLPFPIVALVQYPLIIYILYKIGVSPKFHKINVKNLLVYLSFLIMAIYLAMPSKEFITFLFISIVPFIFKNDKYSEKKKIFLSILILILFSVLFRIYFLFIPIITIGIIILSKIKVKNKVMASISYGVMIAVFLSLSYGLVTSKFLSESSRENLNADRNAIKDANTMIVSPVDTGTWYGESIGIVNGFFQVNLPLNGIKYLFSPQILAFVIWQLLIFYILFVRLSKNMNSQNKDVLEYWLLLYVFSYFILQGIFEPDLGSAIKHKMGIFPLIYFALYYEYFGKKVSNTL
jgi:hypothetical protein